MTETVPSGSLESQPKRRWGRVLLIASLALNLLVAGAVAGGFYMARHGYGPHAKGEFGLMRFSHSLAKDRRDAIHSAISDRWVSLKSLRQETRRARKDYAAALSTETFDKTSADAASKALIDAETALRTARLTILTDAAEKLSPEERRAFETWQKKRRHGWFGKKGAGGDDGPPWRD